MNQVYIARMPKGVVTKHLFDLIAKQVEDRRLVVWYDPERAYADAATELQLPNTTVARYDGSFFQLRHAIDSLLNGEQPPRLVVYVPEAQDKTHHALIELEAAGIVMQPGQQPPPRNTRLAVVARNALKNLLGEDMAAGIEKQIETGRLTLADLNALAEKSGEISTGVLSLIFKTGNPQDMALAFLNDDRYDEQIEKKSATNELITLLRAAFGVELPTKATLAAVREKLARHVLLTDLIQGLGEPVPVPLASVKAAVTPAGIDACTRLADTWRRLRDYRDSYVAASNRVEGEFSLGQIDFDPEKLVEAETFCAVERALLRHVENRLIQEADENLVALARSHQARFWAEANPVVQAHWALIVAAAELLLAADRVMAELKKAPPSVAALIEAYAEGESPWCLMDMHHRHMESRWYNFDPGEGQESLEKLIVKARQHYTEVGSALAKRFIVLFHKAEHPIRGVLRQCDVFETQVKPKLNKGKTAYVWVDALRFEMARELGEVLQDDFGLDIRPAVATLPTITEIGMASLLPKADRGKVVAVGGGKLGLTIDGAVIKNRKDRIAFLKQHAGTAVFDGKLEDLLPKPSKRVRDGIRDARLILITSQEIDELCEQDNIAQARRQMDGVLNDLRRGVRVLSQLGVESIVLAADHGHLFAEELSEDMKIDAPGGDTADLHRRVWVGVGGTAEPSYLRTSLSSLGVDSALDIATPWTFACFKAKGGARAYFHGGASPQELVIPAVTMRPVAQIPAGPPTGIDWTLKTGTAKLTTRFFSVQIAGVETGLFEPEPPKVRIEIRAQGQCVSRSVSASYGFEDATGEVHLRTLKGDPRQIEPNTVALMLVEEIAQKTVGVVLIDAASGAELVSLDRIEVAISI